MTAEHHQGASADRVADLDAARLLLARMGVTAENLIKVSSCTAAVVV